MIARHEILRTTLHEHDGQITQRVGPPWRCGLTAADASPAAGRRPGRGGGAGAVRPVRRAAAAGPGLAHRPGRSPAPVHRPPRRHGRMVAGGLRTGTMGAVRRCAATRPPPGWPRWTSSTPTTRAWHRGLAAGQADADLAYWRHALDGAIPVCPAPDHAAPDTASFSGDHAVATAARAAAGLAHRPAHRRRRHRLRRPVRRLVPVPGPPHRPARPHRRHPGLRPHPTPTPPP